jgi:hypothetical protein
MARFACLVGLLLALPATAALVAINESDYQNPGTDTTEWIELVGAAGTVLDGWQIVLVNQSGVEYGRYTLQGTIPYDFRSEWGGWGGFFVVGRFDAATAAAFPGQLDYTPPNWPASEAIQNGPDDVIQLWDAAGNLIDEWEYDENTPGSVTGFSQPFEAYDSAGTSGQITTYSSIGRRGWSDGLPLFVFDLPHGIGGLANDPFDHETNSADYWAITPRGPVTEATGPEIVWSGTLSQGPGRGISPGGFNNALYGEAGRQDAYTINIIPEPASLLLISLGALLLRRRQ